MKLNPNTLQLPFMLTFNKFYFTLFILLLAIEILIALFVHDNFIRPYIGDALVVILIYCFLKSFLKISVMTAALIVLVFAFTIEFLQLFSIVEVLGLQESAIARTVIGTSFSFGDLIAYVMGIALIIMVENYRLKKNSMQHSKVVGS